MHNKMVFTTPLVPCLTFCSSHLPSPAAGIRYMLALSSNLSSAAIRSVDSDEVWNIGVPGGLQGRW